ncbi:hypothetical protein A4A49_30763 [Nicotiana attenuata]|uniref:Uncharacterized protein n=1 Tax=Nicotiana attenuata TaxID=49451 RepID=A0A1J6KDM8_NICAT|nr:hypothetical protein A4A49_30763 [Nicotiana attenuata]
MCSLFSCYITVWTELEKENKEFFEAYKKRREEGSSMSTESQMEITTQRIHNMLLESSYKDTNENHST